MTQRSSNTWTLLPLLLIAGLSFWLVSAVAPEGRSSGALRHDPDYWVDQFSIRRFDADGRLLSAFWGQKMTHYPDDDSTVVADPKLVFFREPAVKMTASTGLVGKDGKEITLTDTVLIRQEGKSGGLPIELRTNSVVLNPDTEQARADSNVTISQGKSIISGRALTIDNKSGISVLDGPVTATFHKTP